jgi:hypothetical protein
MGAFHSFLHGVSLKEEIQDGHLWFGEIISRAGSCWQHRIVGVFFMLSISQ